jgi:hypothetical protein
LHSKSLQGFFVDGAWKGALMPPILPAFLEKQRVKFL